LRQVVAGVGDYGNRMGIPTVAGAVHFDDRYVGNPLVFCGCVGLIPRHLTKGKARPGDRIVALGGRTGRDGIHGATFSSTELEHTSADEFAHAVQVGNAIEEKRVLDALLRARDHGEETGAGPLYHAVTDCGAGGFSSAVGEMGGELGAEVHLDRAPLKYPGLSPTEVWISEAQERMVLAVPPSSMPALRAICEEEGVELADLGHFGTKDAELVLLHHGVEFGRLSMHFLHEGLPMPERTATFTLSSARQLRAHRAAPSSQEALLALLAHPTIASKHWIVRQYDHEVRGGTVVKPLVGPAGRGPGDAAVIEPIPGSGRGVALSCGLQTPMGDPERHGDPYLMALAAIDEAVRNVVCVGGDPARTAILDNFCWPSCGKPENLGSLVRAAEGCYDAAKAYRTPFVSGKDSLNNQLTIPVKAGAPARTIQIPPTLLITALALVRDVSRCVTMDAKAAGNLIVLVGDRGSAALGGSHLDLLFPGVGSDGRIPRTDLVHGPANARAVAAAIAAGLVRSAHDCSEGGVAVAVAEMLIAATGPEAGGRGSGVKGSGVLGAEVNLGVLGTPDVLAGLFSEAPSRYLVEVEPGQMGVLEVHLAAAGVPHAVLGRFDHSGALRVPLAGVEVLVTELVRTWSSPLDW
jgi:phosphoribosylformylglycinamidine synthase